MAHRIMEHGPVDRLCFMSNESSMSSKGNMEGLAVWRCPNDRRDKASKMKERSRHSPFPVPHKNHVVMGLLAASYLYFVLEPRFGPMRRALKQGWRPIEGSTRFHEWRKKSERIEFLRRKGKRKEREKCLMRSDAKKAKKKSGSKRSLGRNRFDYRPCFVY
ncbi:hypothetical protein M431DRAFT_430129 [Trichoderma harzianum CBS 226.95]|uniref:Uncharacterized protein n=1 Tax=Trichoderma harzianum CBS 226.95 TaxID=983964 RepID=A0A2T4ACR4_TRIHA|nr:hypothetical protein M431DRAFT_430129 [Trichoderma harzianum CBS 226.95]PTB54822.1 hypothetical protein M431DRAFT_430129 [Trichoderma harzianum CBS 226.95]